MAWSQAKQKQGEESLPVVSLGKFDKMWRLFPKGI